MATSIDCPKSAKMSVRSLHRTQKATPPTTSALATALTSSTSPLQEIRRDNPLIGSRRPKSGLSAFSEKFQLPRKKGETSAATTSASNNGAKDNNASRERSAKRTSMNCGSRNKGSSIIKPRRKITVVRCIIHGPTNQNAVAATTKTRKAPISRERGTCPSSRACSKRLVDAGSVFSTSLSSAISGFQ